MSAKNCLLANSRNPKQAFLLPNEGTPSQPTFARRSAWKRLVNR
jgi:hypothetical protein